MFLLVDCLLPFENTSFMRARILFVIYGTTYSATRKVMLYNRHYIYITGRITVFTHHTELPFIFYLSISPFKLSCLWGGSSFTMQSLPLHSQASICYWIESSTASLLQNESQRKEVSVQRPWGIGQCLLWHPLLSTSPYPYTFFICKSISCNMEFYKINNRFHLTRDQKCF